ncbi:MAG TPA: hypothetical protein VFE37_14265 [Chloroflexota bacterium]|nr:hypothetical protein [Chloroflexota bacterium]
MEAAMFSLAISGICLALAGEAAAPLPPLPRRARTRKCTVWELVPAPPPDSAAPPSGDAVPIRGADGTVIAYACPAT